MLLKQNNTQKNLSSRLSHSKFDLLVTALLIILSLFFLITGPGKMKDAINITDASVSYHRAQVLHADNSNLEGIPEYGTDRVFGYQYLELELLDGTFKGKIMSLENSLLPDSYIFPKEGDTVIVSVDTQGGGELYCRLISSYRIPGIVFITVVFVVFLIAICRGKGVRALGGLVFTMITILFYTIPEIYSGGSPIAAALITSALTSTGSLLLLNGFHIKTFASCLASCAGFSIAGLLFLAFSTLSDVSGYNAQGLGMLSYISTSTDLQIKHILFAGVLIASLGAIMDVSMSVASAVYEIHKADPRASVKVLYKAGVEVAKDTTGTMSNTLILAFTGSSLSLLIASIGYGIDITLMLNSDLIAIELGQGLCASAALVVAAPITSLITAGFCVKWRTL